MDETEDRLPARKRQRTESQTEPSGTPPQSGAGRPSKLTLTGSFVPKSAEQQQQQQQQQLEPGSASKGPPAAAPQPSPAQNAESATTTTKTAHSKHALPSGASQRSARPIPSNPTSHSNNGPPSSASKSSAPAPAKASTSGSAPTAPKLNVASRAPDAGRHQKSNVLASLMGVKAPTRASTPSTSQSKAQQTPVGTPSSQTEPAAADKAGGNPKPAAEKQSEAGGSTQQQPLSREDSQENNGEKTGEKRKRKDGSNPASNKINSLFGSKGLSGAKVSLPPVASGCSS